MMGHMAAVAIANPKEMRMKPASQLGREGGREKGKEEEKICVRGQVLEAKAISRENIESMK
jgi:hypothetical protein